MSIASLEEEEEQVGEELEEEEGVEVQALEVEVAQQRQAKPEWRLSRKHEKKERI